MAARAAHHVEHDHGEPAPGRPVLGQGPRRHLQRGLRLARRPEAPPADGRPLPGRLARDLGPGRARLRGRLDERAGDHEVRRRPLHHPPRLRRGDLLQLGRHPAGRRRRHRGRPVQPGLREHAPEAQRAPHADAARGRHRDVAGPRRQGLLAPAPPRPRAQRARRALRPHLLGARRRRRGRRPSPRAAAVAAVAAAAAGRPPRHPRPPARRHARGLRRRPRRPPLRRAVAGPAVERRGLRALHAPVDGAVGRARRPPRGGRHPAGPPGPGALVVEGVRGPVPRRRRVPRAPRGCGRRRRRRLRRPGRQPPAPLRRRLPAVRQPPLAPARRLAGVGRAVRGGDPARPEGGAAGGARPPGALAAAAPAHPGGGQERVPLHADGRVRPRRPLHRRRPRPHQLLQRDVVQDLGARAEHRHAGRVDAEHPRGGPRRRRGGLAPARPRQDARDARVPLQGRAAAPGRPLGRRVGAHERLPGKGRRRRRAQEHLRLHHRHLAAEVGRGLPEAAPRRGGRAEAPAGELHRHHEPRDAQPAERHPAVRRRDLVGPQPLPPGRARRPRPGRAQRADRQLRRGGQHHLAVRQPPEAHRRRRPDPVQARLEPAARDARRRAARPRRPGRAQDVRGRAQRERHRRPLLHRAVVPRPGRRLGQARPLAPPPGAHQPHDQRHQVHPGPPQARHRRQPRRLQGRGRPRPRLRPAPEGEPGRHHRRRRLGRRREDPPAPRRQRHGPGPGRGRQEDALPALQPGQPPDPRPVRRLRPGPLHLPHADRAAGRPDRRPVPEGPGQHLCLLHQGPEIHRQRRQPARRDARRPNGGRCPRTLCPSGRQHTDNTTIPLTITVITIITIIAAAVVRRDSIHSRNRQARHAGGGQGGGGAGRAEADGIVAGVAARAAQARRARSAHPGRRGQRGEPEGAAAAAGAVGLQRVGRQPRRRGARAATALPLLERGGRRGVGRREWQEQEE